MRKSSTFILGIFTVAGLHSTAIANEVVGIPDKVRTSILKRHPGAQDFQASQETHFGQPLLEVSFKDADNQLLHELFRSNGALFSNELLLGNAQEIPPEVSKALAENFAGYRLDKAELVVNPNGIGEEYELYIDVAGSKWKVAVNDKGQITAKDRY